MGKNKAIWIGGIVGFLVYFLYGSLFTFAYWILRENHLEYAHQFFIVNYLFLLPQAIIIGGFVGLVITAILLKRIKNPVYIGLLIAFLVYLIKGDFSTFLKYGPLAKLFFGEEYANLFGNTFLYQGVFQLIIALCIGAFIGWMVGRLKNENK
ncbi:hypothetical protein J4463_04665 [Candidatus Pacearchaeota archaeon]|nr:hypothetical protein [Candidatus Pacearchaeota archaeon]